MKDKILKVKLLAIDVDGVMTDGKVSYSSKGGQIKTFDVHDGLAFVLLRKAGIKTAIITGKASTIVTRRAKDCKIDKAYQNADPKLEAYKRMLKRFKVKDEEVCFMGDDLLDVPILKRVGFAVTVSNGVQELKRIAHYITQKRGGAGAIREVTELILKTQGKWNKVTSKYE